MLKKIRRLKGKKVFDSIYKTGKKFNEKYLVMYVRRHDGQSAFSCVVPLRVARQAVLRNKLRRRCYAVIKTLLPDMHEGQNIILLFKKETPTLTYSALEKHITNLFKKTKLLK